jgi:mannose-6-phosphate isomerase-like protein (cupin superfamily)
VRFSTLPPLSWGDGRFHARIGFEAGRNVHASVGVLITAGDAKIAEHVHEGSWEHLVVLEGQGTMTLAGERVPVKAGEALFMPQGAPHAFEASGGRLLALQIYAPGGPEQRFKALAGK